jgi:uncharacterized membrane-anchored protein
MGLFDTLMGSNPETESLQLAVKYGPMLMTLTIAGIIFCIAFLTIITETSHVPGMLLFLLSGIVGLESMYLMYKQHLNNKKGK